MTIEQFAAVTRGVIAQDGFDEYLPTACYPTRRIVKVLSGVPDAVDIESATMNWAKKGADAEELYLISFKIDQQRFKIVRIEGDKSEEQIFDANVD